MSEQSSSEVTLVDLKNAINEVRAEATKAKELVQRLTSDKGAVTLLANHVMRLERAITPFGRFQQLTLTVVLCVLTTIATVTTLSQCR